MATCKLCTNPIEDNKFSLSKHGDMVCDRCIASLRNQQRRRGGGVVLSEQDFATDLDLPRTTLNQESFALTPKMIKSRLDEYVVGQENAKKVLAVAAYNHYIRVNSGASIEKSNVLLVGPTGCGKTYLMRTLSKILDVPFATVAATSLTETGYIGNDVEVAIERLLDAANGDVMLAQRGIVFIDEVDKLAKSNSSYKNVGGEGVQQALLPLLEGGTVVVKKGSDNMVQSVKNIVVDTTNILFVCGGAFPDMEKVIRERCKGSNRIGFGSSSEEQCFDEDNWLTQVTKDDLRDFGMIPELLGRLPVVASLEAMTTDILKRILTEPKNSIVSQYQQIFMASGIVLEFEDDALTAVAEKAITRKTGARSLRDIMENVLLDLMYEAPSYSDVESILVTEGYVRGTGQLRMRFRGQGAAYGC